jgi:TRAP-type C4-dicarboxylate transport system permease small subunit
MFSYGLYQTVYNLNQTSPAIGLVMSLPYASLPAGFFIMFFITMEEFLLSFAPAAKGEGR